MNINHRIHIIGHIGALALLCSPGCDDPDLSSVDALDTPIDVREVADLSAQNEEELEAEAYRWLPGERQAALAEAAEFNALFLDDINFSASPPESEGLGQDPLLLRTEEEDPSAATCPLELVEPCIASWAICAVRCCDGALFKSAQVCGNCATWAKGACANHGTRKRIRWEWP